MLRTQSQALLFGPRGDLQTEYGIAAQLKEAQVGANKIIEEAREAKLSWAVIDDGLPAEPKLGFPGNYLGMPALQRAFDQPEGFLHVARAAAELRQPPQRAGLHGTERQ